MRKWSVADAAKAAALMLACDPIGLFSVFLLGLISWKADLVALAIIFSAGIIAVLSAGVMAVLSLWRHDRTPRL